MDLYPVSFGFFYMANSNQYDHITCKLKESSIGLELSHFHTRGWEKGVNYRDSESKESKIATQISRIIWHVIFQNNKTIFSKLHNCLSEENPEVSNIHKIKPATCKWYSYWRMKQLILKGSTWLCKSLYNNFMKAFS